MLSHYSTGRSLEKVWAMSQTYVIKVSASVKEKIVTKDKIQKQITLTPIISVEEQVEVLEGELAKKGWQQSQQNKKIWTKRRGHAKETINLEDMTVEAEIELEHTLERTETKTVHGDRDRRDEHSLRSKAQAELQEKIKITDAERQSAKKKLQEEVVNELEERDPERMKELNEITQGVYAESLKRKARQLGTVTEVREGTAGDDYELVIKLQQ